MSLLVGFKRFTVTKLLSMATFCQNPVGRTMGIVGLVVFLAACASNPQNSEIQQEIAQLEGQAQDDFAGEFSDDFSDESFDEEPVADEKPQPELIAEEPPQEPQQLEKMEEVEKTEEVAKDPLTAEEQEFHEALQGPPVDVVDIRFLANTKGGTIVIETSAPAVYKTRLNPETNQYVIEVANAKLPERLKRPYILKEFKGASFGTINAYQNQGSAIARVVIQLKGSTPPVVQNEGSSILVLPPTPEKPTSDMLAKGSEVPDQKIHETVGLNQGVPLGPAAPEDGEGEYDLNIDYSKGGTPEAYVNYQSDEETKNLLLGARTLDEFLLKHEKFYGKPISIQVKDAGVKDVINLIAEEAGLNMVVSDNVSGQITVKLRKVPWDQALILIMKTKNLGYIRQGNVIRIASLQSLEAEKAAAKQIIEARNDTEPLQVKIISISYSSLGDIASQVAPFLSPRGKTVVDNRTSSLIVTDIEENIIKVERLVKELDVAPYQVLIEGKIVEAVENFSEGVGINWLASGNQTVISDTGGAGGGGVTLLPSLSVAPVGTDFGGVASLNLQMGVFEVLGNLDATISLLEKQDLAKVISSPRIITLNREAANFSQTLAIPFITATVDQSGGAQPTVNFQNLSLQLAVTPQITSEGSVIMDINVNRTIPTSSSGVSGATSTSTSSAATKVLVKNNQTAVVGGIYQGSNTTGENRVPVLANIPVLGWLFKSRSHENNKTELVIFVTPRIIKHEPKGA